jgi:two-component system sensor histidine kinase UhpB
MHPDDAGPIWEKCQANLAERKACSNEYRIIHRSGEIRWVSDQAQGIYSDSGELLVIEGLVTDITDRKRAEKSLLELSRRLREVEEAERRAIARELHDRIGQNLAALNVNLQMIRQKLPEKSLSAIGSRLDEAQKLLETAGSQVRNVMADLRPPALDEFGLHTALRVYAEALQGRLGLEVTVDGPEPKPRLPLATEMAFFRIAQEALNNVSKHAKAKHAGIHFEQSNGLARMTVADHGIGYAPVPSSARTTWGMITMRERAEAVGSVLRVESAPGRGTRVIVEAARG